LFRFVGKVERWKVFAVFAMGDFFVEPENRLLSAIRPGKCNCRVLVTPKSPVIGRNTPVTAEKQVKF